MTMFKKIYPHDVQPDGYRETIQKGMSAVRYFSRSMNYGKGSRAEQIEKLKKEIETADAIVIGAGAGLSTSAGFTYSGERFDKYFFDFANRFGIRDMYSGGFYPFPDDETRWAWWARHIYYNRYIDAPKPVYQELYELVKDKDYFVITTNVDHMLQKAGFNKKRLFYTQGDYGLFQSVDGRIQKTYDNEEFAQSYFAVQTRKQELIEERIAYIERTEARGKLRESEKRLSQNIYERGVDDAGFARIRSKGDQALFGGYTTKEMKNRLGVKDTRPLADFLPTLTIAAKNLATEMTNYNVEQKDLQGEADITIEHVDNNSSVREMLGQRGIKPENLPPSEDIKKLERRVKKEDKQLAEKSGKLHE